MLFTLLGSAVAFEKCWNVTVVHDVDKGWNDGCLGLKKKPNSTTEEACGAQCKDDPECIVWQWVNQTNGDLECWSGNEVHGCVGRSAKPGDASAFKNQLLGGQKLQHGNVKVLNSSIGVQVMNLKKYVETSGTTAEQIARCRLACHSDVTCSVWQYGDKTCWMEHVPGNEQGKNVTGTDFAKTIVAGEFVEHYCPPKPVEEGLPWPWIIAGIILGTLALLGLIYYFCKKTPKVKKTRAVKIEQKPEPQPVMYFIPQPTVLIPQTSMIAPVAAPQYTPLTTTTAYATSAPVTTTYTTTPVTSTVTQPLVSGGVVM